MLVLESSRKYVLVSDEDDDETRRLTTERRGARDVRCITTKRRGNALQRANENKPKRRAFKDVERMATNARRYGESARALARSFEKQGKAGRADGGNRRRRISAIKITVVNLVNM